jgi:hypothetical protein
MNLEKPKHITSLATAGLLVSVEVNVWSATKQDRAISNEVTTAKKADQSAGRFVKNLLANNIDHKNLLNYRQTVYNWMQRITYSWNKSQDYLPHVSLPKFMQEFHDHEVEFNKLLDTFCANYASTVANMAFAQGQMFNRNDYPDVSEVRSKFGITLYTSEIPVGDYRCAIAQDLADDLNNHYNKQAQVLCKTFLTIRSSDLSRSWRVYLIAVTLMSTLAKTVNRSRRSARYTRVRSRRLKSIAVHSKTLISQTMRS